MKHSLTRLILVLSLLIGLPSLTGCVVRTKTDTSWVKPIYFEEETLQWLDSHDDWPASLYRDLDKVAKHNDKYERINEGR